MSKQALKSSTDNAPEPVNAPVELTTESPSPAPANPRDVADVAYRRWLDRGCPQGSPEEDWFEAEREVRSRSGS